MLLAVILLLIFAAILYLLVRPTIRGAIYMPTPHEVVAKIVELAKVVPGRKIVDIGSGDGRILIALAKAGSDTTGYEINPALVFLSRRRIIKAGLERRARVCWKSFWKEDLSKFDTVVVYGYPPIMKKLGDKLSREMKPGAKVISLVYPFPGWKSSESCEVGNYRLLVYRKG